MAQLVIFEDVLRTLKRRLEGKVTLDGTAVPVTIDYPDPDWVANNRPCMGILWQDLMRARGREGTGVTVETDLDAGTATVEPYPQMWDMFLQFDFFSEKTLHDLRGMGQLLEALEELASSVLVTETLGERIRLRYIQPFRDSREREFHSGVRYAVTAPLRIEALRRAYPLVKRVVLSLYSGPDLNELERALEVANANE